MAFVTICRADQVPAKGMNSFYVMSADVEVLILRDRSGELRALDGICPHEDYPLVAGEFDGATITCSAHGWIFNAESGRGINPSNCRLSAYPVRLEGDEIQVDLENPLG